MVSFELWQPPYTNTDGSRGDIPQVSFKLWWQSSYTNTDGSKGNIPQVSLNSGNHHTLIQMEVKGKSLR